MKRKFSRLGRTKCVDILYNMVDFDMIIDSFLFAWLIHSLDSLRHCPTLHLRSACLCLPSSRHVSSLDSCTAVSCMCTCERRSSYQRNLILSREFFHATFTTSREGLFCVNLTASRKCFSRRRKDSRCPAER